RAVAGAGYQGRAVWAKGQREDVAGVSLEPGHFVLGCCIPEPNRPVPAGRGDPRAVRVEDRREHLVGMHQGAAQAFPGLDVPRAHGPIPAGGGQLTPVRTEGDRLNVRAVAGPLTSRLERVRVP